MRLDRLSAEKMSDQAPLGKNTKFASVILRRFALQSVARKLLPKSKVSMCLRWSLSRPELWHDPVSQSAHYKKLMVCGRVWLCPVCASKITERRRDELDKAIKSWSGSVFLVTFTLQHTREDKLAQLVDDLNLVYRGLKSGRQWQAFEERYKLVGSISAQEMTVSTSAGWHPHKHVLFFSSLPAGDIYQKAIEEDLSNRFIGLMAKQGRYVSAVYGVKVEKAVHAQSEGDQALKAYVTKWGLGAELAKGPVKSGRVECGVLHLSPFQLLDLAGQGDKWGAALFQEYAAAMKGKKQLVWSRGLRKLLKLQEAEKTDDQLAQETISNLASLLRQFSYREWALVLANDARGEIQVIGFAGDPAKVQEYLDCLGPVLEVWQLAPS